MRKAGRRAALWILLTGALLASCAASASPLGEIRYSELPTEARELLIRIRQGGPFPSPRDGSIFSNRERLLPRGEYREYTVTTPGLRGRGARRILARTGDRADFYYTDDHYRSFRRIIP